MSKPCALDLLNQCLPYFEMLRDRQRQEIVMNLIHEGELSVSDIVRLSDLSMPAISHHLKLLTYSGLVSSRKVGTKKFYRAELSEAIGHLKALTQELEMITGAENHANN